MPTYTVNITADSGAGSLRDAIISANAIAGTTIEFDATIAGQTITLTSELPWITGNNTVIDGGANAITVSGGDEVRVFFVGDGSAAVTATIQNLTIQQGAAQGGDNGQGGGGGGGGAGLGGAIFVSANANLTISDLSLANNAAVGGTGGFGGNSGGGGGGGGITDDGDNPASSFGGDGGDPNGGDGGDPTVAGTGGGFGGGGGGSSVFPPTQIVVLRRLPNGSTIPIKINLNRALVDASQRILVQPGDYVLLQYTPIELAANYVLGSISFNYFLNTFQN